MATDFKFGFTIEAVTKGFAQINKDLDSFNKKAKELSVGFNKVGRTLSASLTLPLTALGAIAIKNFGDQERALAKLRETLRSTGREGEISFTKIVAAADELSQNTLFSDEDIVENVSAQLLRFGNLSEDVFFRAQEATLNLAAKLTIDLASAATLVGKALAEPSEGLASLSKNGIKFTNEQEKLIKKLVETGKTVEAQNIILSEFNRISGNTASVLAKVGTGPLQNLIKLLGELTEQFGESILNFLNPFILFLTDLLKSFQKIDPVIRDFILVFGGIVAAVGPILLSIGTLIPLIKTLGITFKVATLGLGGWIAALLILIPLLVSLEANGRTVSKFVLEMAKVINEGILTIVNFAAKIPGVGEAFQALSLLLQDNIKFLDDKITQLWQGDLQKKNEDLANKAGKNQGKAFAQGLTTAQEELRKKELALLAQADEEFAAEREKNAPTFLEGAFNLPNEDQVALKVNKDLSELKTNIDELNQSERILSDSFSTFFEDISFGAKSASEAFKDLGRSIVNSLFSSALRSALNAGFAGLFPTKADGGPIGTFAEGGSIRGPGTGTSDSILARVSNGEFVMKADSVKKFGLDFMHMLNKGLMPAFAGGGFMNNFGSYLGSVPRFATGGPVNSQKPSVNVNVLNNSSQPVTAKSSQSVDVRGTVINIILEDLKTNGPISQGNQQAFGLRR